MSAIPPAGPEKTAVAPRISQTDDLEAVKSLNAAYKQMTDQLSRAIVGQSNVIEQVLVAIFCRGHALLVGVPGLAKTLLVSTTSKLLHLSFKRIQFTPDLMPADITGTDVLEEDRTTGKRVFRFVHGPIFSNMILADEINRTPPKTQAALLEAMQEHMVTAGENTYKLPEPFFVLATQNPIEQEGTYPLPEAQLDRFMFTITVDYPSAPEELAIIKQVTGTYSASLDVTLTGEDILRLQDIVRRVPVADHVLQYARDLARASRPGTPEAPGFISELVQWGAGPRAGIYLILAAKARAILHGRYHATTEDVRAMALPVLRHRVITTFNAEAAGITADEVVKRLLTEIKPAVEKTLAEGAALQMLDRGTRPEYMRLLDPDALAKIHRLELLARGVVEGFISGRHKSPYKGFSVEFAEHRQYVPGDDTRDLDWRVFGKSDRYYIKQYIEETNLRSVILLDASGSMRYVGQQAATHDGKPLSKFRYGQFLAASLAHLMIHQQDAVGCVTFDTRVRRYIPSRARVSHLRVILQELAETNPGGETALAPILHDIAERAHRRGLIVVISDLFDDAEEILKALHHFRYRKHEVLLLHVMAEEELTFPFDRWSLFRDLELDTRRVQLDPRSVRAEYLDRVREFVRRIETGCGEMDIDYVPLTTKRSFDVALAHYLANRRGRTKA